MAHPQTTPRGVIAARLIQLNDTSGNSTNLTQDSTGVVLSGGVKLNSARIITANSTAYTLTAESVLPGNVDGGVAFTIVSNSTGVAMAVNTSGTTWKYLNVTTKQPA